MEKVIETFELFPWNRNFETGIDKIDEQHKKLVGILNKLAGTLVDENHVEINRVFDELTDYAEYHFQTEERIWTKYFGEDSWLESHQMSHAGFLPKLIEMKENDINGPLRGVIEKIVKFLIRWLAFHIIDNDRRMAIVVKNIDAGKTLPQAKINADEKMNGSIHILLDTVLTMYDSLSSRTLDLMRERSQRQEIERELLEANKKLEDMATTDILTGLNNRRHFQNVFQQELRRAKRDGSPLSFLIFDLDYFKKLNDNYGHPQGDNALSIVGACIKELCQRPGDFSFRIGGEEFCIILSNPKSAKDTQKFSEKILKSIIKLQIDHSSSEVNPFLTASLGAVYIPKISEQTTEEIFKKADENLYQAKDHGRNRIVLTESQEFCSKG